ncbi:hypothetical protein Tco_0093682 [Tanacetum coccineum]
MKGELKNEIQTTIKNQQTALMSQNNAFQNTLQNNLQTMLNSFFQAQASPSGTLPSNTIPNPKGEMKAITTRSGVAYEGPLEYRSRSIRPLDILNQFRTRDFDTYQRSLQFPEPEIPKTVPKANIPYPSRRDNQKNREKASYQKEKIFQMFQDLRFDISFADALFLMPRFAPTIRDLLMNKEKLLELVKIPLNENCSAMLLKKLPEKLGDPGKFLIPCEFPGMEICYTPCPILGASNKSNAPIDFGKNLSLPPNFTDSKNTIYVLEQLLNDDPFQLPPMDLKQSEVTKAKSSIEEPPNWN